MKLLYALLVAVLCVGVCVGQQPCPSGYLPGNEFGVYTHNEKTPVTHCYSDLTGKSIPAQPAPIKCGKYEHVEFDEEVDAIAIPESRHPFHKIPGSERCAPDLHTVTEKEWQEMMERLKKLEKQIRGEGGATF